MSWSSSYSNKQRGIRPHATKSGGGSRRPQELLRIWCCGATSSCRRSSRKRTPNKLKDFDFAASWPGCSLLPRCLFPRQEIPYKILDTLETKIPRALLSRERTRNAHATRTRTQRARPKTKNQNKHQPTTTHNTTPTCSAKPRLAATTRRSCSPAIARVSCVRSDIYLR